MTDAIRNYYEFYSLSKEEQLISAVQARCFITDYINNRKNNGYNKRITKFDMEYWIVNDCQLSACENYWFLWGNTQGCLTYHLSEFCLVGGVIYVLNRNNGNLLFCPNIERPEDFLQRHRDLQNANGKIYAISHRNANDKNAILSFKKFFQLTLPQAQHVLNNYPYLFVGEKLDLFSVMEELSEIGLQLDVVLLDETPCPIIDVSNQCLYFKCHFEKVMQDFVLKTQE